MPLLVCDLLVLFFFFNDTATTEIYTLSLHDALPLHVPHGDARHRALEHPVRRLGAQDRKSTRLNSSHPSISYAVFCLKKKKKNTIIFILLIKKKMINRLSV